MTALCTGNGPSQPVPGTQLLQTMTAAAIIDLLLGQEMSWAAAAFAGVGYLAYNLTDLCATDPPALPAIDAARLYSYVGSTQGAQFVREDALPFLAHYLWFQYCQCVSGTQPTKPAPLPQPPGVQTNNPALNGFAPNKCGDGPSGFTSVTFDATGNATETLLPNDAITSSMLWYQFQVQLSTTPSPEHPLAFDTTIELQELAGTAVVGSHSIFLSAAASMAGTIVSYTLPVGLTNLRVQLHASDNAAHTIAGLFLTNLYCSAPPALTTQPCCPPDPALEALIVQVLQLEQLILNSLGGSSAYLPGTQHTGRTGSASLGVSGLRGIAVRIETGTPTTPELPGNPPYEWNLGWMSILTGDGMIEERRITRTHQVWLPSSMSLALTFGYFLNPGVVATFTELVPA